MNLLFQVNNNSFAKILTTKKPMTLQDIQPEHRHDLWKLLGLVPDFMRKTSNSAVESMQMINHKLGNPSRISTHKTCNKVSDSSSMGIQADNEFNSGSGSGCGSVSESISGSVSSVNSDSTNESVLDKYNTSGCVESEDKIWTNKHIPGSRTTKSSSSSSDCPSEAHSSLTHRSFSDKDFRPDTSGFKEIEFSKNEMNSIDINNKKITNRDNIKTGKTNDKQFNFGTNLARKCSLDTIHHSHIPESSTVTANFQGNNFKLPQKSRSISNSNVHRQLTQSLSGIMSLNVLPLPKSLLCVPIQAPKKDGTAVLTFLVNKKNATDFTSKDRQVVEYCFR